MADVQWSNLPTDILSILEKILNTDVDRIRLRSICSSWRASIRPRLRPHSFPLKLPPFNPNSSSPDGGGHLFLSCVALLHLSRPNHGRYAGDPSDGWLFRVLEVSPNLFSVLVPFFPTSSDYPSGTVPKSLNLLDYRIYEVCKCYHLTFFDGNEAHPPWPVVKKALVLWNYAIGCEFAVLALFLDWRMSYLKFGDKEWTEIDTMKLAVTDVVVCKGVCYGISRQGVLVSLDSNFNLTVVDFPHLPANCVGFDSHLVEYKSDLYVFTKILEQYSDSEYIDPYRIPMRLEIFKKCSNWKPIECLGDDTLLSCDDYSFGLSVKDFRGLRGNCVYMAHTDPAYSRCFRRKYLYGFYDLENGGGRTSIMDYARDQTLVYWPTPGWLMSS